MGTASVELMWHIWEDGAEKRRQLWEGVMGKRYNRQREGERGGRSERAFDLTFNKPLPEVSLDVVSLVSKHPTEATDFHLLLFYSPE